MDKLPRGHIGVTPRPTTLADESYLDFIQSFRKTLFRKMFPVVSREGEEKYAAWKQANRSKNESEEGSECENEIESTEDGIDKINRTFNELPSAKAWQRLARTQQEMMWRRTRGSFIRVAKEHLVGLAEAESKGPSELIIEPGFETPNWARQEIHLQPGGYTEDPISGIVYHYGTRVFYEGRNDQDEIYQEYAGKMAKPTDGKLHRILDIGCSIGQGALALKKAYPDADVVGIDVALPVLRYAHKRANDFCQKITFKQALAEQTGYPDSHFDSIFSYILFHECPIESIPLVIQEMYRVLRPGGVLSIFEFPNHYGKQLSPAKRFMVDFDSRDNGEPYSLDFIYCNFRGILEEAGFTLEDGQKISSPFLQAIVARKDI